MFDQSVTGKNLRHLLRRGDRKKYSLGHTKPEYRSALDRMAEKIASKEYEFGLFHESEQSHGRVFTTKNKEDEFAIRKLNDNIKRVYSIKSADRNVIVPQVISLSKESSPFYLVKVDIEKFFDSVNRQKLLEALFSDSSLSYITRELLRKLFESPQLKKHPGLPRGLSISSTLAEYCLKEFDRECRRLNYCYYYVRYVDDMLFFCHVEPKNIFGDVAALLPFELKINQEKSIVVDSANSKSNKRQNISYLGYQFTFSPDQKRDVQVSIAPKKIKKIKTRIILALRDYIAHKSFDLLLLRIQFISSNYRVSGKKQSNTLYSGIYYNYRNIDHESREALSDIDEFMMRAINSKKGSLGKKLSILLSEDQKRLLCSHSVKRGHVERIHRNFKSDELKEIKGVWSYA